MSRKKERYNKGTSFCPPSRPPRHRTNNEVFNHNPFEKDNEDMRGGFLFYDNLVRGAGLGHSLGSYNYGLIQAMDNDMFFLPQTFVSGHNLGRDGMLEFAMGLPENSVSRKVIERRFPERITRVEHCTDARTLMNGDYSRTKKYFQKCYRNRMLVFDSLMIPNKTNIAVSIRRGDIILNDSLSGSDAYKARILPDSYYIRALGCAIEHQKLASSDFHIHVFSDGDQNINENNVYINEKGKKTNLNELFSKWSPNVSFLIGEDTKTVFKTLQACSESDIFIASNSGFSSTISLFMKEDSLSVIPSVYYFHPYHNPNYIKMYVDEEDFLYYYFKKENLSRK